MANRKNVSEEKLSESIAVTEEYLRDKIYEVRRICGAIIAPQILTAKAVIIRMYLLNKVYTCL